ncbi:MAG: two-component system, NarL family, sensor kinase, partial [Acidimicrobiaceae bacterium]|nr:two-component system, NarL family, sensor kinase [Acidimicrobiaceae bacterium]
MGKGATRGRRQRQFSVGRAVASFAAAGLAAVFAIGATVFWVAHRDATTTAVRDARDLTVAEGQNAVEPVLSDGLFAKDPQAISAVDRVVRGRILSQRVVRIKVWAPDGTILYSDQPALIGQRFPLGAGEEAALSGGAAKAEVSNLNEPENVYERPFDKLLEVYDGVSTPSGSKVLYEAYLRFSSVSADSHRALMSMIPALVLGLALLFLIQVPLAWSLARRVQRAQIEEQRLLQRAIVAGEVERRHIAADLHDGVVQ